MIVKTLGIFHLNCCLYELVVLIDFQIAGDLKIILVNLQAIYKS